MSSDQVRRSMRDRPAAASGNAAVSEIVQRYETRADRLIEMLHDVNDTLGQVSEDTIVQLAAELNLTRAHVYGVVSFYHDFSLHSDQDQRQGRKAQEIEVCNGEACQSCGAVELTSQLEKFIDSKAGAVGQREKPMKIKPVFCLGNCALAPAVKINQRMIGRARLSDIKAELADIKAELAEAR